MRVKLIYECDFDDVPEDVSNLLTSLRSTMLASQTILNEASQFAINADLTKSMEKIDELRQSLSKVDLRLMDCSSILASYAKSKADLLMGEFPESIPQGTQEIAPQDILESKGEENVIKSEKPEGTKEEDD